MAPYHFSAIDSPIDLFSPLADPLGSGELGGIMKITLLAAPIAFLASAAFAQVDSSAPVQAVLAAPEPETVLPAGTEIPLKLTQSVTTKGDGWDQGDEFTLNVAADVRLGEFIIIPRGTKAVGHISWLTSRGAFGKSGKMDVEIDYLQMGSRRINLDGSFRQEGDGATLATIGGVIAAGVFAGFITGKSATIPQGRELLATLESDLAVNLPRGTSTAPAAVQAVAAPGTRARAVADEKARREEAKAAAERVRSARPPAEIRIGG